MIWQEIVFLIVIFLVGVVQAITGFSGVVLAMPPALRLIGLDVARPVLNIVLIAGSLYFVIRYFKQIQWKEFLIITLLVGVGFGAGFALELLPLNMDIITKVYGALIAVIAIVYFFVPLEKINIPMWVFVILLIFAGILHKFFLSAAPLVMIYALKKIKEINQLKGTLSLVWILLGSVMLGQHAGQGLLADAHIWLVVAAAFACAAIAYVLGYFLRKKVPFNMIMKVTYVLLFVSGISLII